ncbi:hypothetical protein ABLN64_15770 [Mycobacterium tuberculosis]
MRFAKLSDGSTTYGRTKTRKRFTINAKTHTQQSFWLNTHR